MNAYDVKRNYIKREIEMHAPFIKKHGGPLASAACFARNISEAAGLEAADVELMGQVAILVYLQSSHVTTPEVK